MDHESPLISVVIPTYNIADYIKNAIQSVLSQTYPNIEVIMVDDCSSDNTVSAARGISDPRLTVIEQPQNGGPSLARNTGFQAAKGEWIAVLDGDDFYLKDRLEKMIATAIESNADIVVDNLIVNHEKNKTQLPMFTSGEFQKSTIINLTKFIEGNQLFLGGYTLGYLKPVFKARFLKEHSLAYSTDIRIGEDYLLMAECLANHAKCITVPYAGYSYLVRASSISHRLNEDAVNRIEAADRYFISKYTLSSDELSAQTSRSQKLYLALSFTKLVDAIKSKNIKSTWKTIRQEPLCLLYLWRPIWAKITRF